MDMDRIIAGGNEGNYRRLFAASVFATEEAIINSMIAAEDMTGHNGFSAKALPHEELREVLKKYNRLEITG